MLNITGLPSPDSLHTPQSAEAHWPWVTRAANAVLDVLMTRSLETGPSPSMEIIAQMMDVLEAWIRRVLMLMALTLPAEQVTTTPSGRDLSAASPLASSGEGDFAPPFSFIELKHQTQARPKTPDAPCSPKPERRCETLSGIDLEMAQFTLRIAGILRVTTMPHAFARQLRRRLDRERAKDRPMPLLRFGNLDTPLSEHMDAALVPLAALLQRATQRAFTRAIPLPPD